MARRPADVNPERRALLNAGLAEAANLAEALAVDFAQLLQAAVPGADHAAMRAAATLGVTRRMALAGQLVAQALGDGAFAKLADHPSDTVRGSTYYALAGQGLALDATLNRMRPLAADRNAGVREWAWLALLEPLRADPARYVHDSVANWLNDAGKEHPVWVRGLCRRWQELPGTAPRILERAQRNLA
jgi:hypothetical protein